MNADDLAGIAMPARASVFITLYTPINVDVKYYLKSIGVQ